MIEIKDGLTSVSVGADEIPRTSGHVSATQVQHPVRAPTGARVTLEFHCNAALAPNSEVRVRYEFETGRMREAVGVALPTRTEVRWGRAIVYHYRLSQWIEPAALMKFVPANVRYRTDDLANALQHPEQMSSGTG